MIFPDFEDFSYEIAARPPGAKLRAWAKLEEAERRLAAYEWAESINDPAQPRFRVLLNDCASAFVMTFEAALQFVKEDFKTAGRSSKATGTWIKSRPENDLLFRGIGTLRHLEAHVEPRPVQSGITAIAGAAIQRRWCLSSLQQEDLEKLRTPKLAKDEVDRWYDLVKESTALDLFRRALRQLNALIQAAENELE